MMKLTDRQLLQLEILIAKNVISIVKTLEKKQKQRKKNFPRWEGGGFVIIHASCFINN